MHLWQDLRFAARTLRKSPGFAATAVVTLALGIGATTAIFSICDALLWKPLPVPNLDRLVTIVQRVPGDPNDWAPVTPGDFADLQRQLTAFAGLTCFDDGNANLIGANGEPESVNQFLVAPNFFEVMGAKPAIGRTFAEGEDHAGRDRVVVLSDALWRRRFGADREIVGKYIRLDDADYLVTGVMPPHFEFPFSTELWTPLSLTGAERASRDRPNLAVMGLLRPGRTPGDLAAQLATVEANLAAQYPDTNKNRRFRALGAQDFFLGHGRSQYLMLWFGSVLLVLLIACVNVANLQFAHALGRSREVAVRLALGAGRRRMMAQFLTESLLLAMLGAPVGMAIASFGIQAFLAGIPRNVARHMGAWNQIALDHRALLFTIAAAAASGILAGLLPALQCSRQDLNEALKEGGHGSSAGRNRQRLRAALVAAEVALSVVLLVGASLMARGLATLAGDSRTFEPSTVLSLRVSLSDNKYPKTRQVAAFYDRVLERASAIPGVKSAFVATSMPYGGHAPERSFEIEGRPAEPGDRPTALYQVVSPNYFSVLHIRLLAGRFLTPGDRETAPAAAVISARTAQRWWPNEAAPIGRRLRVLNPDGPGEWITIVGIVADVPVSVTERAPQSVLYLPLEQAARRAMNVGIRVAGGNPARYARQATAAVLSADSAQLVSEVFTLDELVKFSSLGVTYVAVIMGIFGLIALVLSSVGVYGVMSYLVAQQIPEIGIRMALGAPRVKVLAMVFRRGLAATVAGLGVGLASAFALARLLAGMVFGVSANDPATFLSVPLVLLAAALLAMYIPARRATAIDPLIALRYE